MEGTRGSGEDAVCAATLDRPRSGLAWAQGKWRLRRYAAESIPPSLPAARMGGGVVAKPLRLSNPQSVSAIAIYPFAKWVNFARPIPGQFWRPPTFASVIVGKALRAIAATTAVKPSLQQPKLSLPCKASESSTGLFGLHEASFKT